MKGKKPWREKQIESWWNPEKVMCSEASIPSKDFFSSWENGGTA